MSNSKGQFEPGFVTSAIRIIHFVFVALLAGTAPSAAMQNAPAAGVTVLVGKLSDRAATADYLLYLDGERANTAHNTVIPSCNDLDTVWVKVTY